jgi:hypothetical protein
LVIFGDDGQSQALVFKLDTEADEWGILASMMPPGFAPNSAKSLGGKIYLIGRAENFEDNYADKVLCFEPVPDAWDSNGRTLCNHKQGAVFVLGESLYVAGSTGQMSRAVERYDVTYGTWVAVGDMLESRCFLTAVTIGSKELAIEQDLFDSLIAKAHSVQSLNTRTAV